MPKVSIIIPNYNHAIFLKQRIDSVLNQSFQDFEIIILDDCSTDDSRDVIELYKKEPQVSTISYNKQNGGNTFLQWEKGISIAKGEFIWIAESDDWCENTLLEELISGINSDKNCAISYCQSYCIEQTNKISWLSQHPYLMERMDGHSFIQQYMVNNNTIFNASMVLWRKELFNSVSKEFLKYKFCGDWLFWIELAKQGNVHISGKLMNYFRKHGADVTGKATKSGLNFIENIQLLNHIYLDRLIHEEAYSRAFKNLFKKYWKEKRVLDPLLIKEIEATFKTSLSSKSNYYKLLLSAIWKHKS
ncbi:glycosyltransferase [Pedobacter sp. FW305-3-2-15-E-R2A2]|jgi:glycosyltransferase involved in cell wall biosynthesis|uniref:glycosyltransferase family 2 protein n=1 Tax=Pedobacter sp. FW305-3-2-15-E-R2A2 TaxID=3140251 RepID=UPI0031401AEA